MSTAKQRDYAIEVKSNQLVEIIRERTENTGNWVVFRHRDIPSLLDTSAFSVKKIIETVKMHPNILFEEVEHAQSSRKPFQFRYVSAEDKIKHGFSEKNFYYLDQDEINMIIDRLDMKDDYQMIYKLLSFVNVFARSGAKEKYVKINIKHLAELFIITKDEVEFHISQLLNHRLLSSAGITDHMYMLLLAPDAIERSKLMVDSQQKIFAPTNLTINQMEKVEEKGFKIVTQNKVSEELINELEDRLKRIKEESSAIRSICDSQVHFLHEFYKTKEEERTKFENNYNSVQLLLEENSRLKEEVKQLKDMNKAYENTVKKNSERQEALMTYMQEVFDILIADIMHTTTEFTSIPPMKQTTVARSRFERNIIGSVTKASDDIISYDPSKPQ